MVLNKDIYDKLVEFERRKPEFYEMVSNGGFKDPALVLTLIKEAGYLSADMKGAPAEQEASEDCEKRYGIICQLFDDIDGKKAPKRQGIDALLG